MRALHTRTRLPVVQRILNHGAMVSFDGAVLSQLHVCSIRIHVQLQVLSRVVLQLVHLHHKRARMRQTPKALYLVWKVAIKRGWKKEKRTVRDGRSNTFPLQIVPAEVFSHSLQSPCSASATPRRFRAEEMTLFSRVVSGYSPTQKAKSTQNGEVRHDRVDWIEGLSGCHGVFCDLLFKL